MPNTHARTAPRGEACECGLTVYGPSRRAHYRTCPDYLRVAGWPLDEAQLAELREDGVRADQVRAIERRIADHVLSGAPNPAQLSWRALRDFVWDIADRIREDPPTHA